MCVALKSNLYHINDSKAPRQNARSPISTHQLLPLKSPIVWVQLRWLVGILMWRRLPVCLFPLASSQTLAKTLVRKVITHRQLGYCLSKQVGEEAILKGFTLRGRVCTHQRPSRQHVTSHTPAHVAVSHFLMQMSLAFTLFRSCSFMSNKGKYLDLVKSTLIGLTRSENRGAFPTHLCGASDCESETNHCVFFNLYYFLRSRFLICS